MNITIQEINDRLAQDADGWVRETDAAYIAQLEEVADHIWKNREKRPVILLSGPSGSGKTTTAHMLERLLEQRGSETHTLSMDNYFIPLTKEQQALAAQEKMDLESPARVDIPLLNAQLASIIAGEPTEIPHFDFTLNIRTPSGWVLERRPEDLVILEGIHALNPTVITIPDEQTVRLYVSVRTRMITADSTPLHPMEIRLLRRMLRDIKFRGRQAADTLRMFRSVQRGEENHIMPYKHRSSYDIDTFCAYEVSVYKPMVTALLEPLAAQPEIAALLPALEELHALDASFVPSDALIREFIGGSEYA